MATRWLAVVVAGLAATPAWAGVVVLGNYTGRDVTVAVAEDTAAPRRQTVLAYHVVPVTVAGPARLWAPAESAQPVRLDPYHAYVLLPDPDGGVTVELVDMPGRPPERDLRPELNPRPREPVVVPVTLLVDDADPRADPLWQAEVRRRFEAAAAILADQTGFRPTFAGYGTWKSDPQRRHPDEQLAVFERSVAVRPGALAVGFLSRKLDDGPEVPFGACRGRDGTHILVREWRPKTEPERVEVLVCYLARALGAVASPDPGSALRSRLGDGRATDPRFVIRLDPLNALALNLWADLQRAGITRPEELGQTERVRLVRVYTALERAAPDDPAARRYREQLERDPLGAVRGAIPGGEAVAGGRPDRLRRLGAVRGVVVAITQRCRANNGPDVLTGDAWTAELVRVAAEAALQADAADRVPAFLLGLGIALDDTDALRDHPATAGLVKDVETSVERAERLKLLGNPTLRNRRDLCRRFFVGCARGEWLAPRAAEAAAVADHLARVHHPTGFGFPSLAAEWSGLAFARAVQRDPKLLHHFRTHFRPEDVLADTAGLRDGLSADKFEDDFGGPDDDRFRAVLDDIRRRVHALMLDRPGP